MSNEADARDGGGSLGGLLRTRAAQTGAATWLISGDRRLSFAEANRTVNRYAAGIQGLAIAHGDRVAMYMEASIEFVLLALAINKLGAIWVPANTEYRGEWLRNAINSGRPSLIITDRAGVAALANEADRLDCRRLLYAGTGVPPGDARLALVAVLSDFDGLSTEEPDAGPVESGDTAAILWTSGTTGAPKGVMQSHNVWIRAAEHGNRNLGTTPDDIVYSCLPLYNSAAWGSCIFRSLVAGIPCVIDPHFSVSGFWDRIRLHGVTQTMTLGAMHIFLWNAPPRLDDRDNPLRIATMVPFPEHLVAPFCERFGLEAITQGYGQSEVLSLLMRFCRPDGGGTPNSLGEVISPFEIRLVDEDGREVAAGEVGEFTVRAHEPHAIFNGYFDQPEATAAAFVEGWYHTGDLGRRDAAGDYFFVDRKKDYIRYKGRSISSSEIEMVTSRHPGVAACAAFGVTSAELDSEHEIKLDVVLKPGASLDPEELARFINDHAPYFFVPRYIEIKKSLPYTPTNKVEKYRLRVEGVGPDSWDRDASGFRVER